MISNFLFIFLRGLGADEVSLGLTMTIATFSELPILFLSDRLLRAGSAAGAVLGGLLHEYGGPRNHVLPGCSRRCDKSRICPAHGEKE